MDAGSYLLLFKNIEAANAAANQTQITNKIAQEQLDWAKKQWAEDKATNQPIIDSLIKGMDQSYNFAKEQKDFYDQNYKPVQQALAKSALEYDTPEYQAQRAGEAGAEVAQQFKGAQDAAAQQLKDFGINVSSPKYASGALTAKLAQAGATAGAQNKARNDVRSEALALQGQVAGMGQNSVGAINQTQGVGQNAGNSAVSNTLATTQTGAQTMGTAPQYYGQSNAALNTWGNIANGNYQNYVAGYQADKKNSSGWGSALGLVGGMGMAALSNPAMKFAEGGAVYSEEGGAVPAGASPSGGAAIDDVPAMLNDGEFVIPKEAVSWFGEKYFHDMIIKAQKQREQTQGQSGAVPAVGPAPQAAALPVG